MSSYNDALQVLRRTLNLDDTRDRLLTLDEWRQFRRDNEAALTPDEMQKIIEVATRTLQGMYVHMDLKKARRGIDPISQLRALDDAVERRRTQPLEPREFHNGMLDIFKALGDVHTAYRLPEPAIGAIAFLPFLVNAYFNDGDHRPHFIVSHVLWKPDGEPFDRGMEVVSWNGTSIEDAIKRSSDFEEGSNPAHDFALGLQSMTVRWLGASFEPDVPWVVVGYKTDGRDTVHECEFEWRVLHRRDGPRVIVSDEAKALIFGASRPSLQPDRGTHVASQVIHAARKLLFVRDEAAAASGTRLEAARELISLFADYVGRDELERFTREREALLQPNAPDERASLLPSFFTARVHEGRELVERVAPGVAKDALDRISNKRFGYIGIRAFAIEEPERSQFKYELRRLLSLMPSDGLILDIRDNPGGSLRNAEESLQFLTAGPIEPLPFRFIATPLTKTIAAEGSPFVHYRESILTALGTGASFSAGRSITPRAHANTAGQHYFGPVIVLTSATTYSAGDVFAAGFLDNAIDPVHRRNHRSGRCQLLVLQTGNRPHTRPGRVAAGHQHADRGAAMHARGRAERWSADRGDRRAFW
jgi:hypothetical protein